MSDVPFSGLKAHQDDKGICDESFGDPGSVDPEKRGRWYWFHPIPK